MGLTQQELGDKMDRIHLVQVHKYEMGINRMSVSKMWEACHALNVTPGWFFKGCKPPFQDPTAEALLDGVLHAGSLMPEVALIAKLNERDRQAVAALILALAR